MSDLLQVRGLTVELPTPADWVRPVNDVSLRIGEGDRWVWSANRVAARR